MAHVYIEDIGKHEGEEVTIKGWLHNRRSSGKIHFLVLRDGSGFIQAVMSKAAVGDEVFKAADHLSQETSVTVTGMARADKRSPSGYEIDARSLEVVGESHEYPITPKEHGVDYLLDLAADHRDRALARGAQPEMAVVEQEVDAVLLRLDRVVARAGADHCELSHTDFETTGRPRFGTRFASKFNGGLRGPQ